MGKRKEDQNQPIKVLVNPETIEFNIELHHRTVPVKQIASAASGESVSRKRKIIPPKKVFVFQSTPVPAENGASVEPQTILDRVAVTCKLDGQREDVHLFQVAYNSRKRKLKHLIDLVGVQNVAAVIDALQVIDEAKRVKFVTFHRRSLRWLNPLILKWKILQGQWLVANNRVQRATVQAHEPVCTYDAVRGTKPSKPADMPPPKTAIRQEPLQEPVAAAPAVTSPASETKPATAVKPVPVADTVAQPGKPSVESKASKSSSPVKSVTSLLVMAIGVGAVVSAGVLATRLIAENQQPVAPQANRPRLVPVPDAKPAI